MNISINLINQFNKNISPYCSNSTHLIINSSIYLLNKNRTALQNVGKFSVLNRELNITLDTVKIHINLSVYPEYFKDKNHFYNLCLTIVMLCLCVLKANTPRWWMVLGRHIMWDICAFEIIQSKQIPSEGPRSSPMGNLT